MYTNRNHILYTVREPKKLSANSGGAHMLL
jgi:hypothetical protein